MLKKVIFVAFIYGWLAFLFPAFFHLPFADGRSENKLIHDISEMQGLVIGEIGITEQKSRNFLYLFLFQFVLPSFEYFPPWERSP
jgi:hypothetical protein